MTTFGKEILALPDGTCIPYISDAFYQQTMRDVIEPELSRLRTETEVPVQGGTLHAENYVIPGAKKALIMLHGYTESAEKLREMVWYFIKAGFSVFSYDERGHGRSLRLVDDLSVTHAERFSDYVDDLEAFILCCVKPHAEGLPLYLYGHSMGGAVSAQFLVRHPELFRRAVLSSPMIAPSSAPFPLWMGHAMAGFMCLIGQGKTRAFIGGPFDAEKETFETSCSTSRERFNYYWKKRASTPYLQNCSPTYRWVLESVRQTAALKDPKKVGAIRTEVLLCQAVNDSVVLTDAQDAFIALVPNGAIERFSPTRHEIYNSEDAVMHRYMQAVLGFLLKD